MLALGACRSPTAPAEATRPAGASPGYTLVLLKTGPRSGQLPKEENEAAFAGHFANMSRLAEAGQLVSAGPFGAQRHDAALRGIFVLPTDDLEQAAAWAGTDPTTHAGVFVQELHALETDAPLARALQNDLERKARRIANGETPVPGEGARAYVLLWAEDGAAARRELSALRTPEGGVYLLGTLDGTRAFAILDAATRDEAAERFAPWLAALGPHELDEWFASDQLARMVAPAGPDPGPRAR